MYVWWEDKLLSMNFEGEMFEVVDLEATTEGERPGHEIHVGENRMNVISIIFNESTA